MDLGFSEFELIPSFNARFISLWFAAKCYGND